MSPYDSYSKEELIDIINGYANGSKAAVYSAGVNQLVKLANEFERATIDISSDEHDKTFSNFLNFMKTSKQIQDSLDELQKSIDPTIVARIKKDASKAGEFSVEAIANLKKQKNE